jgi:8-oxo-dGTP diphosphatase
MAFVYAVAFSGDVFLMIRNRRSGWEMPGGTVEPGETPEKAIIREFSEETGGELRIISSTRIYEGTAFFGTVDLQSIGKRNPVSEEVAEVRFFSVLPEELSYPREEYEMMLQEARGVVKKYINRNSIGDSCAT